MVPICPSLLHLSVLYFVTLHWPGFGFPLWSLIKVVSEDETMAAHLVERNAGWRATLHLARTTSLIDIQITPSHAVWNMCCVSCVWERGRERVRRRKLRDEVVQDGCYLFGVYTYKISNSPSGVKYMIYAVCHKARTYTNTPEAHNLSAPSLPVSLVILRSFVIQQIPSSNLFMVVVDNKCHCRDFGPITMDPIEIMYIL